MWPRFYATAAAMIICTNTPTATWVPKGHLQVSFMDLALGFEASAEQPLPQARRQSTSGAGFCSKMKVIA